MKEIRCHLGKRSYTVYVGRTLFSKIGTLVRKLGVRGKVLIVTNRKIEKLYYGQVKRSLTKAGLRTFSHLLPDSEAAKSERELFRMYNSLLKAEFDRYGTMLALGGGIIGDVSAFCASTYMRGINFINVPTTLLAQVDSAIGGKTAINLAQGKNLVGSFYQPKCVISDISCLASLSRRQRAVSLAEVIKYGIIWNNDFFAFLEKSIDRALAGDVNVLEKIVCTSSKIKVHVVERDEQEVSGLRAILNFGHTFAHGFEAAGTYTSLAHGEAVALGMIAAARLAQRQGIFTQRGCERIESLLKRIGLYRSLRKYRISTRGVLQCMHHDKKKKGGKLTLVLPTKIGHVTLCKDVATRDIKKAIESLFF